MTDADHELSVAAATSPVPGVGDLGDQATATHLLVLFPDVLQAAVVSFESLAR